MAKKIIAAVGILWITCSFFLYGGIRNDSLPADLPEKSPFPLTPEREKKLLAEEGFARLFTSLPDGLLREKKEWDSFFSLLDKTPDSIFLSGLLVNSYQKLPNRKEKEKKALQLAELSRKHPGKGVLAAISSDLLAEAGKVEEANRLLEFHLAYLKGLEEKEWKKLIHTHSREKDQFLYMARSRARYQLVYASGAAREKELRELLELFPDDLILLQFLLRAQYEVMEKADGKKTFFSLLDSPKEKKRKEFLESCQTYLTLCRKELQKGTSLHLGRYHKTGLFYLGKTPWKEEKKNLLLEECIPKYPALDLEELFALASLFEKEKKPLSAAMTLLRLLKEEVFPCNTFHFLLAEEKLRGIRAGEERIKLFELAVVSDPENLRLALALVQIYWQEGREKKAWKILKELFPHPQAYMTAARRMYALRKWQEADRFLQKAMASFKHPAGSAEDKDQVLFRALILDRMGEKREVEKILRNLLKIRKEDHQVLNFLGYMLADENRLLPEAESLIRKALAGEDNQAYRDSLAWVCYRKKDFANAIIHIEKAISLTRAGEKTDSLIYDHAGDIYFAAGKKEKALAYWKKAASCYSPEYDLVSILAKIRKAERKTK